MGPRICFLVLLQLAAAAPVFAQYAVSTAASSRRSAFTPTRVLDIRRGYGETRRSDARYTASRRRFVTVSYDWHYTQPLHFAEHPLEDFLGMEVASTQAESYEYRTRNELTLIDVLEFSRRQQGLTVTVFPLGLSTGPALALRGSIEPLPVIRLAFVGPAPFASYALTNARALDAAIGLYVADRSSGWGLGSHAFVLGGIGKITSDAASGNRYFAEGGGGLSSGPFGVDLSVKFAGNRLADPLEHRFLTVPITIRGTLSF